MDPLNQTQSAFRRTAAAVLAALTMAAAPRAATLSIGSAAAEPGAAFVLPVSCSAAEDATALQFDLSFDPVQLAFLNLTGAALPTHDAVSAPQLETQVRVVVYSPSNASIPDGTVVNIPLALSADALPGLLRVTASEVIVSDTAAARVPNVAVSEGAVTVISATAPMLSNLSLSGSGEATLQLTGVPGASYVIETSSDLKIWVSAITNLNATGTLMITDPGSAGAPIRFYRAFEQP